MLASLPGLLSLFVIQVREPRSRLHACWMGLCSLALACETRVYDGKEQLRISRETDPASKQCYIGTRSQYARLHAHTGYILWSSIKYIKLRVVTVLESVLELETVIFLVSKQAPRFRKKILYQC